MCVCQQKFLAILYLSKVLSTFNRWPDSNMHKVISQRVINLRTETEKTCLFLYADFCFCMEFSTRLHYTFYLSFNWVQHSCFANISFMLELVYLIFLTLLIVCVTNVSKLIFFFDFVAHTPATARDVFHQLNSVVPHALAIRHFRLPRAMPLHSFIKTHACMYVLLCVNVDCVEWT